MEGQSWKAVKTIPQIDLEKALPTMTRHQIDINIVEILLIDLYSVWCRSTMKALWRGYSIKCIRIISI